MEIPSLKELKLAEMSYYSGMEDKKLCSVDGMLIFD